MLRRNRTAILAALMAGLLASGATATATRLITGRQIKNGTITAADVKKHSLTLDRLAGHLQAPSTGATGPQGPPGPAGPAGLSNVTIVDGPQVGEQNGLATSRAVCPTGQKVVAGGYRASLNMSINYDRAEDDHTWAAGGHGGSLGDYVAAQAVCANTG